MIYFVVEGKSDSAKLNSILPNCRTIETNGSEISKKTLMLIKKIVANNKVIIFTDPDGPGKKIRQKIINSIPNCQHAFILKHKAIKGKKVGLAEAKTKDILESLKNIVEFSYEYEKVNSWMDFVNLGYVGKSDSKEKRKKLCSKLKIPYANSKTLFKWINMIGYKL